MTDKVVLLFVVALAAAAPPAAAQSHRASMRGLVTDSTGAVLRGANVEATQRTTNERRTVTTDEGGRFAVPELPVGPYVVEITLAGYRSHTTRADLAVGEELWLDVPLNPSIEQSVEVNAPFVPIDRDSPAMATLIDQRQITGLPLDGRNFLELALLAPGTAPAPQGSASSVRGDFAFTVNGAREDSTASCSTASTTSIPSWTRRACARRSTRSASSRCLTSTYDASFGRNAARTGQRDHALRRPTRSTAPRTSSSATARLDARNSLRAEPTPRPPTTTAISSAARSAGRSCAIARSSLPTTRGRACARASRGSPTCRRRRAEGRFLAVAVRPAGRPVYAAAVPGGRFRRSCSPIGAAIAALYPLPNRAMPLRELRLVADAARRHRSVRRARRSLAAATASRLTAPYSFSDRRLLDPFARPGFSTVPGIRQRRRPPRAEPGGDLHARARLHDRQRRAVRLQPRRDRRLRREHGRSTTRRSACPRWRRTPRDAGPEPDLRRRLLAARPRIQQPAGKHVRHVPDRRHASPGCAARTW